jgi:chorismate mutase/prephenate dehydratase
MIKTMEIKKTKKEIKSLRNIIDKIDNELVKILNKRAIHVIRIQQIKKRMRLTTVDKQREKRIMNNISRINKGPLSKRTIQRIFSTIIKEIKK